MSPRVLEQMRWLWYLLFFYAGPVGLVNCVTVRTPPSVPSVIEAQAKFFQDFFSVQLSPYKLEFGHVCEDPDSWEQRYEKKDYKNHRDMGKVRWGDKKGGYGEHYWDLNHAGNAHNIGNNDFKDDDDSSKKKDNNVHDNEHDNNDENLNDEPSELLPNYEEYDPEIFSAEEESARAKRAHPRIKSEAKEEEQQEVKPLRKVKNLHKGVKVDEIDEIEDSAYKRPRKLKRRHRPVVKELNLEDDDETDDYKTSENENTNEYKQHKQPDWKTYEPKQDQTQLKPQTQYETKQYEPVKHYEPKLYETQKQFEPKQYEFQKQFERKPSESYVPYEAGAGVRQYHAPDVTPAASMPRLFLEPSTGHVVDRTTGQAYVLQPIVANNLKLNVN